MTYFQLCPCVYLSGHSDLVSPQLVLFRLFLLLGDSLELGLFMGLAALGLLFAHFKYQANEVRKKKVD